MMDRPIKRKKWPPKRIALYAIIAVVCFLLAYGIVTSGGGSTLRIDSEKVTISTVKRGEFLEYITVNGTVMPITTFYLDAVEGGRVQEVFLEEGSYVNVGDSILQLDNTDLHLDIMYREAQLFEQINNLRNTRLAMEQNSLTLREQLVEIDYQIQKSRRKYEQSIGLKEKSLISDDEFEQAGDDHDYWLKKREITIESQRQDSTLRAIQVEQLEASVVRMQTNLEVVKNKLGNLTLTAPVAGHLTSLTAEVGESKARGERLGQIDVLDGFKLRAAVDEYYIARIGKGQKAEVKIGGEDFSLTIKKVYPEVRDGRFQVDLEFDGGEPDGIRRGQTVQIKLALGDLSEAILLARGGFYHKTGGNWAYVVDESGAFASRRELALGRQNPHVYEVLEGLEPGERVITSSYDNFGDYDRLVLKNR
jgi:HlyD family secretion protein